MSDARPNPGLGTRDLGLGARESSSTAPVDLDAAIDIVAREMTAFEPSGALRARVLERIEQGRRRTLPAVPRWAWAGGAAAVVVAVATAIWVISPMRTPGNTQTTVAEQRSGAPSPTPAGADRPVTKPAASPEDVSPARELAAIVRTSRTPAARGLRTAEADDLQERHPVPALAEIEPLRFSAVGPDPLQIAAVEVPPLAAMPSIDIPSLGPDSNDTRSADPNKEK